VLVLVIKINNVHEGAYIQTFKSFEDAFTYTESFFFLRKTYMESYVVLAKESFNARPVSFCIGEIEILNICCASQCSC
jgi:hypothetical protein